MNLLVFMVLSAITTGSISLPNERLVRDPNYRFATLEEGRNIITAQDEYLTALSPFDRAARMKTDQDVSPKEFIEFLSHNVTAWTPQEIEKLKKIVDSVRKDISDYPLRFPRDIYLIKTTGKEEGQASYTRQNAIFFPARLLNPSDSHLKKLFIHELFHIYSRYNPKDRNSLYHAIGFVPCNEIEIPQELQPVKLTNPDAPRNCHYLTVKHQGEAIQVVPFIYSRQKRYDVKKGGEFFNYLVFQLLAIEKEGDRWKPRTQDSKPILLDVSEVEGFYENIGRNTHYIIHPEEILAENFVLLIQKQNHIPSPEIITRIKNILSQSDHKSSADSSSKP